MFAQTAAAQPLRQVRRARTPTPGARTVSVAIEAGAAQGAFAWGVLDRLLEDGAVDLEGISATNAGGLNGLALAYGMALGGSDGARRAMACFWRRMAHSGSMAASIPFWFAPDEFGPLHHRKLSAYLEREVDFDVLNDRSPIRLFLSLGRPAGVRAAVCRTGMLSAEAVLASACMPQATGPVASGVRPGHPMVTPLAGACVSRDVILIRMAPQAPAECCAPQSQNGLRIDAIEAAEVASGPFSSAFDADWEYLTEMREHGRDQASRWLARVEAAMRRCA